MLIGVEEGPQKTIIRFRKDNMMIGGCFGPQSMGDDVHSPLGSDRMLVLSSIEKRYIAS